MTRTQSRFLVLSRYTSFLDFFFEKCNSPSPLVAFKRVLEKDKHENKAVVNPCFETFWEVSYFSKYIMATIFSVVFFVGAGMVPPDYRCVIPRLKGNIHDT